MNDGDDVIKETIFHYEPIVKISVIYRIILAVCRRMDITFFELRLPNGRSQSNLKKKQKMTL